MGEVRGETSKVFAGDKIMRMPFFDMVNDEAQRYMIL
jgi:hypothetical protein